MKEKVCCVEETEVGGMESIHPHLSSRLNTTVDLYRERVELKQIQVHTG